MTAIQKGKTSVAISAKEEQATITEVVKGALPYAHEVVVICDSALDPTLEAARKAGARTVINTFGKGKGNAIRFAIDHLDAEILVLMDADGSHDPRDIPALVKPIQYGDADMVVGSRMTGGSDELSNNWLERIRMFANLISAWITNKISGYTLSDVHNGYRAVRTESAREWKLQEKRFAIEPEMVLRCGLLEKKIEEVPTHEFRRKQGESRLIGWIQVLDCVRCYIRNCGTE